MADYNLPSSRKEVFIRMMSDVKSQLPSVAFLKNQYFLVLIASFANRAYDIYKKSSIIIREAFIQTAQFDESIAKWGAAYGLSPNASTTAIGNVALSGTAGGFVPANTILQNSNGDEYTTSIDATIALNAVTLSSMSRSGDLVTANFTSAHGLASGFIFDSITGATPSDFNTTLGTLTVTSDTQVQFTLAGTAGAASGTIIMTYQSATVEVESSIGGDDKNLLGGSTLTLSTPIANVNDDAYVTYDEITGGNDVESTEDYHSRILFRLQNPHAFFNNNEIISKAKEVNSVTRVWVFNPDSATGSKAISSITRNGQVATATCVGHGLTDGKYITVLGAVQSDYNISSKRVLTIDDDTFCFIVANSPTTPATGTITFSYSIVEEGQVAVYATTDKESSIIPSSTIINRIKDKILEIKPAHTLSDDIIVASPTEVAIPIVFATLSPNITTMQTAINASIDSFFRTQNEVGRNVKLVDINNIISSTIDSTGTRPSYTLSSPSGDTVITAGSIGNQGTITYP